MLTTNHNSSTLQKHIAAHIALALLIGSAVWVVTLLRTATYIRSQADGAVADATVGPLLLTSLSKHPIEGGYSVSISLGPDLLWYVLAWTLVGVASGLIYARLVKTRQ